MKRFKNILCVIEFNKAYKPALERAVALARNNQASLTVATVMPHLSIGYGMPEGGPISTELQNTVEKAQFKQLQSSVEPYRKSIDIATTVLVGTPFLQIIREIMRHDHDLLIKPPEDPDWLDRLFGSNDMHLLRKCPCPVWLVKPQTQKTYCRILAAVDVEPDPFRETMPQQALNQQILEMAASLALTDSADLHIGTAWDAPGEMIFQSVFSDMSEEKIDAYLESTKQQHRAALDGLIGGLAASSMRESLDYLKPETHLLKGPARTVIPTLAKQIDADLIVMGTVARTGIPGFLMGNTAEAILNQIECSVLAVKPPGFVTPITLEE